MLNESISFPFSNFNLFFSSILFNTLFSDSVDQTVNVNLVFDLTGVDCATFESIKARYMTEIRGGLNNVNDNSSPSLCQSTCNDVLEAVKSASCVDGVIPISLDFGLVRWALFCKRAIFYEDNFGWILISSLTTNTV